MIQHFSSITLFCQVWAAQDFTPQLQVGLPKWGEGGNEGGERRGAQKEHVYVCVCVGCKHRLYAAGGTGPTAVPSRFYPSQTLLVADIPTAAAGRSGRGSKVTDGPLLRLAYLPASGPDSLHIWTACKQTPPAHTGLAGRPRRGRTLHSTHLENTTAAVS